VIKPSCTTNGLEIGHPPPVSPPPPGMPPLVADPGSHLSTDTGGAEDISLPKWPFFVIPITLGVLGLGGYYGMKYFEKNARDNKAKTEAADEKQMSHHRFSTVLRGSMQADVPLLPGGAMSSEVAQNV